MKTRLMLTAALVWGLAACGHEHDDGGQHHADKQSAQLPIPNPQGVESEACGGLTYKNAAKPLADKYCVRCHTTPLVVRPNEFAATGLDDEASWIEHGGHALKLLRAGAMPLVPPVPMKTEIERLTRWLACEDALRPHSHDQVQHN